MPTVKEREKATAAKGAARPEVMVRYFGADGAEVKTRDKAMATPQAVATTIALTLHNGATTFEMQIDVKPNSYPFVVTGGQITSGICGAPWDLTGGHLGDDLRLEAKRAGSGSCASKITVVGEFQNPPSYRGTYGFDGATGSFTHTTVYHC